VRNGCGSRRSRTGTLGTLLLLAGALFSMCAEAKSLTTILLVARGGLSDPFFARSIVLVMNDLGPGPVGIIVNRPTAVPVSRLFPQIKRLAHLGDKVYFGGPVEFHTVWFLFRAKKPPRHAVRVLDGVFLSGNKKLLLRLLAREKPMQGLRIYVGHAGWAPGQLQAEISAGAWSLRSAQAKAIFGHESEVPWPSPKGSKHGAERTVAPGREPPGSLRALRADGAAPTAEWVP
jgi:putative transcriptional regulator